MLYPLSYEGGKEPTQGRYQPQVSCVVCMLPVVRQSSRLS